MRYGLASRCARVRACDVAVLDLEEPGSNARDKDLSRRAGAPVLEGVGCALMLAAGAARLGLGTSKINSYSAPRAKQYAGAFERFSPR